MIESFRHKGLKRFFDDDDPSKLPPELIERIRDLLTALDAAASLDGLDRRSFRLHPPKGKLRGLFAVTVRANWRIVFRYENGTVRDVDFLDYH